MAKFNQGNIKLKDNQSIYLGDDNDSSLKYDGTDLAVSTPIKGAAPTDDAHLTTKGTVDTLLTTVSGDIVDQIPTDYISDVEMTVISGDLVAQIPTDFNTLYYTKAQVTTISGDIVAQIPVAYISDAEMATISGDIVAQIPSLAAYATDAEVATISGDIVTQIPSLTGYATESWVGTNYPDNSELTTVSGDIVAQIPDVSNFITDAEVATISGDLVAQFPSDFYTQAEVTTISGDIVAQIPSLAGYATTADVTTVSGDIVAQIPSLSGYATESYVTTVSGDIVAQIPTDYITDAEMTTISGDIMSSVSDGYISNSEMTTISGDIVAQVLKADGSVALSGDLLPAVSGTVNLGSAAMPFADVHTIGGTIYMDGVAALSVQDGDVIVGSTSMSSLGNVSTMIIGAYTGDGSTSKAITGVGGAPKRIEIYVSDNNTYTDGTNLSIYTWIDGFDTIKLMVHTGGNLWRGYSGLVSVDADGFTVTDLGSDDHPNKNGRQYKYCVWY